MKKTFKRYGGETTTVELKFTYDLMNKVVDRFGEEALVSPMDEERSMLIAEVNAGKGVLAWRLQFGERSQIVKPESLRGKMREKIYKRIHEYRKLSQK